MLTIPGINGKLITQKKKICVYLGTFDPFHRGHAWLIEEGFERFDGIILLLPLKHFHKDLQSKERATLEQRLEMVSLGLETIQEEQLWVGWTDCILYLELATKLHERFPKWDIHFLMGDETFTKLKNSEAYYHRLGLVFGKEKVSQLRSLQNKTVVFNRSGNCSAGITCPPHIRMISSTRVRQITTKATKQSNFTSSLLHRFLKPYLFPAIIDYIIAHQLYSMIKSGPLDSGGQSESS